MYDHPITNEFIQPSLGYGKCGTLGVGILFTVIEMPDNVYILGHMCNTLGIVVAPKIAMAVEEQIVVAHECSHPPSRAPQENCDRQWQI